MRSMTIFNFLLEAMLIGSALILLMFAIRALGRGRISNRVIYTLWLVVALRLLLPISLPNPLMNELRPTLSVDGEARPVADQIRTRFLDTVDALSGGDGAGAAALSHLGDETRSGRAGKWLVVAYGAAGCMVGVVLAIRSGNRRSRILRNRLATPDENLMAQYNQLCQRYGVKPVPVYLVQKLTAPCVVGVFRPFIAIPQSSADTHIPHMLAHEICHIKAADHLWSLVRSACCILHWINPLVWLAAYLSREDAELACDTRVIGKIEKLDRLSYAAALASAAGRSCTGGNKLMLGGKWLKRRINGVIHSERARNWGIALCSLCCAVVLIAAFATRESHKPVFVRNIPQHNWVAAHEPLNDPQTALACARRFLETPFIGVDTSDVALTCEEDPQGWRITAQSSDPERNHICSLLLSPQGEVLLYDGSAVLGELSALSWLHTLSAPSDSLDHYAAAFAEACLPGRSIAGATPVDDLSAGGGVHLVLSTLTDKDGVLLNDSLVLMIEPEVKIVMYEQSAMNGGV